MSQAKREPIKAPPKLAPRARETAPKPPAPRAPVKLATLVIPRPKGK